jgi:hypothetical protein
VLPRSYFALQNSHGHAKEFLSKFVDNLGTRPQNVRQPRVGYPGSSKIANIKNLQSCNCGYFLVRNSVSGIKIAVTTERIYIISKHNQQDATLHNGIYYYKCSTCSRRFLRPSSGAQNYTQHRVFVELLRLLTACSRER